MVLSGSGQGRACQGRANEGHANERPPVGLRWPAPNARLNRVSGQRPISAGFGGLVDACSLKQIEMQAVGGRNPIRGKGANLDPRDPRLANPSFDRLHQVWEVLQGTA